MPSTNKLLALLDEAACMVSGYSTMNCYSGYDTGAEFAAEIQSLRERVAQQDWSALGMLIGIFAPTGAWDDGVGRPGMDLANRVMASLDEMDWSRLDKP